MVSLIPETLSLIYDLFNTPPQMEKPSTFDAKIRELQETLETNQRLFEGKTKRVAILGAGPAGLIRGIQSLLKGFPTTIIEKRSEHEHGRDNTVHLNDKSLKLLEKYGIYDYLLENHMIYPAKEKLGPTIYSYSRSGEKEVFSQETPIIHEVNVRLGDLETAMKAVIAKISPNPVIHYQSHLEEIVRNRGQKADLIIRNADGADTPLNGVDILVNAEGSHSRTNELLHNPRVELLPKLPVLMGIFQDDRQDEESLLSYSAKTVMHAATSTYYYATSIYKYFHDQETLRGPNRHITGSLILTTPGQNYVGAALSKEETARVRELAQKVKDCEAAQKADPSPENIEALQKAQKENDEYLKHWISISFCKANVLSLLSKLPIFKVRSNSDSAGWLPLNKVKVIEIGADRVVNDSGILDKTIYMVAGDALCTVDPTTGLGCNSALVSSDWFDTLLTFPGDAEYLASSYQTLSDRMIGEIHLSSCIMRETYRPDVKGIQASTLQVEIDKLRRQPAQA